MAKTILDIARAVTAELQLPIPAVALTSTDLTVKQLLAMIVAACDELTENFDWQALIATHTFTTTDGVSLYALPADYQRLLSNTAWDRSAAFPVSGNDTPQTFQRLTSGITTVGPYFRFRVIGSQFELIPIPATAGTTLAINYISRAYVIDGATGLMKTDLTQDSDKLVFNDRLVINFVKLKLLQVKGFDTTAAVQDFNSSYAAAIGQDVPSPSLLMAGRERSHFITGANVSDGSWS